MRRCAPQNKIENEVEVEDRRRCAPQNENECGCAAQNEVEVENGAALCAAERDRVRLRRTERDRERAALCAAEQERVRLRRTERG